MLLVGVSLQVASVCVIDCDVYIMCELLCATHLFVYVYVYVYVERQQERGVLKHVRKTRNHWLIFGLISRYF